MPRPRGGDWLEDEIWSLKSQGVDILVSMLTPEEEVLLGLEAEEALARRHGLEFFSHPTPDRDIPSSANETWKLARSLAARFAEGKRIAAHCRMGIGRSPLMLACILVTQGLSADEAWTAIGEARGCPVPDTLEQLDWLDRTSPRG
ncbi:MAG: dual specificity protein phosphatase family protein [Planctomycetes bacterium]|nr:dual specificity protein phosphatase family protein [Planctomycetota bacterium]